ncbi:hypothetical protein SRHO_G00330320 [Serrasalmus rhombeus]
MRADCPPDANNVKRSTVALWSILPSMRSLSDEGLDEAHCLWALCPHPCCWETEHRIAKGIYRRAARKPTKRYTPVQESLPSQSMVSVSEWAGRQRHSEGKPLYKMVSSDSSESEGSLHSVPCLPVLPQTENTHSDPAASLASPTSHSGGAEGKGVKLNTVQVSPPIGSESPWGSGSLVLWVPNPNYVPHRLSQERSPKYTVEELICLPARPIQKTSKVEEKPKSVKKKVRFHLACSPLTSHSRREAGSSSPSQPDPALDSSVSGEEQTYDILRSSARHPSAVRESRVEHEPEDLGQSSTFMPTIRPVFLHTVRERGVNKVSKDAPTSLYKMDSKTGEESVDWDSLRQQTYLWKRHNLPQLKDCRSTLFPPGGTSVSQENFGFSPISMLRPHQRLQSPLSVAPAAWHCGKGIWRYQQSSLSLLSHSKKLHSTALETDTVSSVYSTSTVRNHSSQHGMQMLDTDEKSVKEEVLKGSITPFNSLLCCQHSNQKRPGSECERSVFQVCHSFPEESNPSANSSLSIITGVVQPWRESRSPDRDPGPKEYQLSTPPPSLNSL